jgi:hypothetical protein
VTNRSRARWSLAVAFAAHALAMAWTFGRSRPPSDATGAHGPPIEIELADEPEPPVALPAPPVDDRRTEPEPQAVATHVPSRATRASSPTTASVEAPAAPASSAETAGEGSWSFSPVKPSAQPGAAVDGTGQAAALDKATAAGIGAVLAEAERKAEDRKRRPQIFTSRDMETGMVPGGQYVSLTRDRVRNSLIPLQSHALLEFWTDSRGLVARVRVLDATSDRRAWDDVAEALVEDAHATYPLKVPSNADGLIVTLDVTSVMKTLSGAMASRNALVKAIGAIEDPVDAVLDSKAVPQRVVSTRIVGVEAF